MIFLSSCSENQAVNSTEKIEFGAGYSLVSNAKTPFIQNNSLVATVTYSGCNDRQIFQLMGRNTGNTAELWLFKETPDQPCDAYFREERIFTIPVNFLMADSMVLITPDLERIVLR